MRIIVCVKQICHIYSRTGSDPDQKFLEPEDKIYRVNPYDEVAMELALRLKEGSDHSEVNALTLGPIIAGDELRRCVAMGADKLYQIDIDGVLDPRQKSRLLAGALKSMEVDLILCGKESQDGQNGRIGAFIAHNLGLPFVSAISKLEIIKGRETAIAQRGAGRGMREIIECRLPAVFSVDLGRIKPRLPTYEARKAARSLLIRKIDLKEDKESPKVVFEKFFPPRPRPKMIPAPDSGLDAYTRIGELLSGSRVKKKGVILGGSPESQADGIISFLEEHGFLDVK